ncbi:MAG: metallophosphoesterase [Candidatus Coproplasma sp.]
MTPLEIALIIISCLIAVGLFVFFCWFSNSKFTVENYTVNSEKAPEEPVKIVHLSDLHAKRFGKDNRRLIAAVAAQKPDFIAFTGDIIHLYRKPDEKVAISLVRELSKIAPLYYVSGNHEMRYKNYRDFSARLSVAGAVVLENACVRTHGITLVGLGCAQLRNNTIYEITPQDDSFKVLLAHEPQHIRRYARAGYDLALCGHAHGGQWRIPFTGQGVYAPGQGLLPQFASGRHTCGSMQMIISRGLGNSEFPLRIFNRPEVLVITVAKSK